MEAVAVTSIEAIIIQMITESFLLIKRIMENFDVVDMSYGTNLILARTTS